MRTAQPNGNRLLPRPNIAEPINDVIKIMFFYVSTAPDPTEADFSKTLRAKPMKITVDCIHLLKADFKRSVRPIENKRVRPIS